jgi:hypothetical protein
MTQHPTPAGAYSEAQLDLCTATLMQVCPSVAEHVWAVTGHPVPSDWTIVNQGIRNADGRPSDLVLVASDGRSVHIEHKLNGGRFEPGQLDGYEREVAERDAWTMLVAPRRFLETHRYESDRFSATLSVEDLAALASNSSVQGAELQRLVTGWTNWLRELAERLGRVAEPHELTDWVSWYRAEIELSSDGRLRLQPGTMTEGRASFAWFASGHPANPPFELAHKIEDGLLDLRVPGWTEDGLREHLRGSLPGGDWRVDRPRQGRKSKVTGEVTPVLRLEVERLTWPYEVDEESERLVRQLVEAGLRLADWLDGEGDARLRNGSGALS